MKTILADQIKQLKDMGHRVYIEHYRQAKDTYTYIRYSRKFKGHEVETKGGITFVSVVLPNGDEITRVATCSIADTFCYRTGALIALGRVVDELNK